MMAKETSRHPHSVHSDTQPETETSSLQNGVEDETEIEPEEDERESDLCFVKHGEHERLELLAEVYHRASGGAATATTLRKQSYSSPNILKQIKSPSTKNTVLHIAALYGNDDMADRAAQQEPHLISSVNQNHDTPLHVAARAGHISTIKRLLDAYFVNSNNNVAKLLKLIKRKNKEGNTMLHEAMMNDSISSKGTMIFDVLEAYTNTGQGASIILPESFYEIALDERNKDYESVLYLAVEAGSIEAVNRILDKCPDSATPDGLSPLLAAIDTKNTEMLETIVGKKEKWIHLRDPYGGFALHFAAEKDYREGVCFLLETCKTCSIQRNVDGYFPVHVAARKGHVKVVEKLLEYCLDVHEMLDWELNNILHIAAESGQLHVVNFILQTPLLEKMINQSNMYGDTPLHVATRSSRPSIVHALTWHSRVKVEVNKLNFDNQTPLDIAITYHHTNKTRNPSLRQSLARIALQSAGAEPSRSDELELVGSDYVYGTEQFRGRVESMSVISTLIVTASVAACLAVPGEADGTANNLTKHMFHLFIFFITVSLFSSISATIILIWGRFEMFELLNKSMEVAMPLLGTALVTLSLAFLAGIYTVVSELTWLATTFVIITSIFVAIVFFLYVLLFLPSTSTWKISRYLSYYPFMFLASLAEKPPVPRFLVTLPDTPRKPPGTKIHSNYNGNLLNLHNNRTGRLV